ncbi:MAG TPA: enolase C-terminal domain-like protein [Candidatus Acidoferrum sp.]|nr:enolase C-terminal domain-like protein [Candidatus Acidoferrum sp.]
MAVPVKITSITARRVLDSRGESTVEVDLHSKDIMVRVAAPSGKSRGKWEVQPFPDGGVDEAVERVRKLLAPELSGMNADRQEQVDEKLHEVDGTERFSKIGGNTAYAVSIAAALLSATAHKKPLYQKLAGSSKVRISLPLGNVVGGGAHAKGKRTDIQEFLVVPTKASSAIQAAEANVKVHSEVAQLAVQQGVSMIGKGDEGGYVLDMNTEQALDLISKACQTVSLETGADVRIGLDVASSSLWDEKQQAYVYKRDGKKRNEGEQIEFMLGLIERYRLVYVEDPLHEDAFEAFAELRKKAGGALICGDDLLVTNAARIDEAVKHGSANAIIIKTNQVGTLSDSRRAVEKAQAAGYVTVMSHRSGEVCAGELAQIAVGLSCPMIKCGVIGGERISKLNELVRIEEDAEKRKILAGMAQIPG